MNQCSFPTLPIIYINFYEVKAEQQLDTYFLDGTFKIQPVKYRAGSCDWSAYIREL